LPLLFGVDPDGSFPPLPPWIGPGGILLGTGAVGIVPLIIGPNLGTEASSAIRKSEIRNNTATLIIILKGHKMQ